MLVFSLALLHTLPPARGACSTRERWACTLDVDHFRCVNTTTTGTPQGDDYLRAIAQVLRKRWPAHRPGGAP